MLKQCRGVRIGRRVDDVVGITIATQESLQSHLCGRLRLADQHGTAGPGFDQPDPPQDQRTDDAFAEVGLRNDQCAQLTGRNEQRFDLVVGRAVDERGAAGQLRNFGEELPRSLPRDGNDVT